MYPLIYIVLSGASPIVNVLAPLMLLVYTLDPSIFVKDNDRPSKGISYAITELWAFEQLLWF